MEKPLDLPRPRPKRPGTQLASNSLNKLVQDTHCVRQRAGGRDAEGQGSTAPTHWRETDKYKASWNTAGEER